MCNKKVSHSLVAKAYDERLVTIQYTYNPDEVGRTIMLECCTNGIGTRSGEVPDYTWERYFSEPPMPTTAVGVNSHTLFFPNFSSADIGRYRYTRDIFLSITHGFY